MAVDDIVVAIGIRSSTIGGRENPPGCSSRGYDVAIGGTENADVAKEVKRMASRDAMTLIIIALLDVVYTTVVVVSTRCCRLYKPSPYLNSYAAYSLAFFFFTFSFPVTYRGIGTEIENVREKP